MFQVGQKVVCVDDSPTTTTGRRELSKGAIYTVRWCGYFHSPRFGSTTGVRLFEVARISCPLPQDDPDLPFNVKRFRPIDERKQSTKTGMTILRGLLNGAPVKEDA